MILRSNLPRLRELASASERVLDVGGWYQPFNLATHVIDLWPFATRRQHDPLDPEDAPRFSAASWQVADVCVPPWPYPDQFFDFAVCSHLLEDVRDPIAVCGELKRVARAGYIETPSRLREIFAKGRFAPLRAFTGALPEIGFSHHRWFVELEGAHLRFTAKMGALAQRREYYLTRGDVGRKLTPEESGLALFWDGDFTCEEAFVVPGDDYPAYRRQALARLRGK